jgi:hypothetical protein
MLDVTKLRGNYSADVQISLDLDGVVLAVARTGPEYVVLSQPTNLPPCHGTLRMMVDGRETSWPVFLKDGAVPFSEHVSVRIMGR